jgi:general secretion pathway protein H
MHARVQSAGFTLIEILVVVLIIGILSAGVLLSINLTGRDVELERESDRLLALVNYAREQAELQTREYGVVFHDDGYQFVAYDVRRGAWRGLFEDDALHTRRLPDGLSISLTVESRPVVLTPTGDIKPESKPAAKPDAKTDPKSYIESHEFGTGSKVRSTLGNDDSADSKDTKPQVMLFSNGDLTSFEVTLEREGGVRSVTLAQDEKGQVIAKPMVERRT